MRKKKAYRIFMGVTEVAGMMGRLNNAFHEMGIKSDYYWLYDYGHMYTDVNKDNMPKGMRRYLKHTQKIREAKHIVIRRAWSLVQMFDTLYIFLRSLFAYDQYIYIFGRGLFDLNYFLRPIKEVEFYILKKMNKQMVMWLCGSDSRAPYCDMDIYDCDIEKIRDSVIWKKNRLQMLEKYMLTIDYPASSHFHSKPYIHFGAIGIPVDEEEIVLKKKEPGKVKILHAPSKLKAKGTELIRSIVSELKTEGYEFDYVEVTGLPHEKVLEQMASVDIAIDQMYADTPMAGFATECAVNGTPVIVCGYYAEHVQKTWVKEIPPTVYCEPENMKQELIGLLMDEEKRREIGRREKEYCINNNMSKVIAKKILAIFDGKIPREWWFEPERNEYIWGWSGTKADVTECVKKLIDKYGADVLCLPDGKLRKKYMELYEVNNEDTCYEHNIGRETNDRTIM